LKLGQRFLAGSVSGRFCWYGGGDVTVDVGRQLIAHVSGIRRCGSPWACPLCAPVVREKRATDIDQGLGYWLDSGGGALFVTHTLRHGRRDALAERMPAVSHALRHCLTGQPWKRRAKALGYRGAIKAVEVTWGLANGWHPHSHTVLILDRPATQAEVADLQAWLFGRWDAVSQRRGLGTLSRQHGLDVRQVERSELGGYLTKVEGGWGVGLELARSDLKRGRADRMNPVEILRAFCDTGETKWAALWREYEAATYGRRAVVWSPGLRELLGVTEREQSDQEAAAAEGMDEEFLRVLVGLTRWNGEVKAGTAGELLAEIENLAADLLAAGDTLTGPLRWPEMERA
jgi:hypothetical protein